MRLCKFVWIYTLRVKSQDAEKDCETENASLKQSIRAMLGCFNDVFSIL